MLIPNVTGTSRATAMLGVRPGIAPTMIPTNVAKIMIVMLIGAKKELNSEKSNMPHPPGR
jgi:hypothetical protein